MVIACSYRRLGEVGHCPNWYVTPYEETFERCMVSSEFLIYWKMRRSLCYEENEGFAQMRLGKYAYVIIENAMSVFWQCAYSRLECHIGIPGLCWTEQTDLTWQRWEIIFWCIWETSGVFSHLLGETLWGSCADVSSDWWTLSDWWL